jgi:hypothetical protein
MGQTAFFSAKATKLKVDFVIPACLEHATGLAVVVPVAAKRVPRPSLGPKHSFDAW